METSIWWLAVMIVLIFCEASLRRLSLAVPGPSERRGRIRHQISSAGYAHHLMSLFWACLYLLISP